MNKVILGDRENPRADGPLEPTGNPDRARATALCRRALEAAAARDPMAVMLLIDAVQASLDVLDAGEQPHADVHKRTA